MKKYMRDDTAVQIYNMVLPYFDYADTIYDQSFARDLQKLQRVQNRCLKICLGRERRSDTKVVHKLSNVPFLKERRTAHMLNFMYKRKSNVKLLNRREIRTRAHDAPLFDVGVPRCEAYKRSVGYFGSVLWNQQTAASRNADSYLAFKHIQKKAMFQPLSLINVED